MRTRCPNNDWVSRYKIQFRLSEPAKLTILNRVELVSQFSCVLDHPINYYKNHTKLNLQVQLVQPTIELIILVFVNLQGKSVAYCFCFSFSPMIPSTLCLQPELVWLSCGHCLLSSLLCYF
jgi:hypothetical protein